MPVKLTGPLFDGTAVHLLTQAVEQGRLDIADRGLAEVKTNTRRFRNPTGRYESHLHVVDQGTTSRVLPSRTLPYVRWLEGTSRRNQTTRFKGYHLFRDAFQRLQTEATQLMTKRVDEAVRRING